MELIGKTTIDPLIFYSGKISGYILWILMFLSISGIHLFKPAERQSFFFVSYALAATGLLLIITSSLNLGRSTRLGLPSEKTELKINGLYVISRNPMYVGFNLLTISSMIYSMNIFIMISGLYSIWVYHRIILGEERFLEERFGGDYLEYKKKVRRYF